MYLFIYIYIDDKDFFSEIKIKFTYIWNRQILKKDTKDCLYSCPEQMKNVTL